MPEPELQNSSPGELTFGWSRGLAIHGCKLDDASPLGFNCGRKLLKSLIKSIAFLSQHVQLLAA